MTSPPSSILQTGNRLFFTMRVPFSFLHIGFLAVSVVAQYPSTPLGLTKVKSTVQPGVEITYKEVTYVSSSHPSGDY